MLGNDLNLQCLFKTIHLVTMATQNIFFHTCLQFSVQVYNEPNSVFVPREVELGMWYAVFWQTTDYWFVGRALDIETSEQVRMEFIHQTAAGVNSFKTTTDVDSISVEDVLIKVE